MGPSSTFCLHCRHLFAPETVTAVDEQTEDEHQRWEMYRKAVAAGFYSDWP
jgi:hypothetical protein